MRSGTNRASGFHVKERQSEPVGTEESVLHTYVLLLRRLNEYGTRTVSEEHTGGAVAIVDERRHLVRSDNNHFPVASALNHRCRLVESVKESAARSLEVERECVLQSKLTQNDRCR